MFKKQKNQHAALNVVSLFFCFCCNIHISKFLLSKKLRLVVLIKVIKTCLCYDNVNAHFNKEDKQLYSILTKNSIQ